MSSGDNLFERYDIDPTQGPEAITERFRELAEEADEAERAALREAWERLTIHPRERLTMALRTFPEHRCPTGSPPGYRHALSRSPLGEPEPPLTLKDLAVIPSVRQALGAGELTLPPALPDLSDDPLLQPPPPPSEQP